MHWVDRGPEPDGLKEVCVRYTSGWVRYYHQGEGSRPSDARWQTFRDDLSLAFNGLCAYCEERSSEEVEHFRPVSHFPELVYKWSNWLLACSACNRAKGAKWPSMDYVDPCAEAVEERPEAYFIFDTLDGTISPRRDLSPDKHDRAATMIEDLNLNGRQHMENRKETVAALSMLKEVAVLDDCNSRKILDEAYTQLSSRSTPLSSIIRVWLDEQGYSHIVKKVVRTVA